MTEEVRISADGHMGEPPDLWEQRLPAKLKDRAPRWPQIKLFEENHHLRAGGWEPEPRLKDMDADGLAAEVLYPTLGLQVWALGDEELEDACIRVYNDWMIEFCSGRTDRLWGLGMMPLRNIDRAVEELERCWKAGLKGAAIWIAPPRGLPYSDPYYEPFWQAANYYQFPLAMHINSRAEPEPRTGSVRQLHSVNGHKFAAMDSLGHIIASGVLERYPHLQVTVAEVGCGWIPFWLQEFDYYTARGGRSPLPHPPSFYFERQCSSTFIMDQFGCSLLPKFGLNNFLWSSDYPHPACIWPDSVELIQEDLGHLTPDERAQVVALNTARIYNGGKLPPAVEPGDRTEVEEWVKTHPEFGATARPKTAAGGPGQWS